jgi:hypothetical protein
MKKFQIIKNTTRDDVQGVSLGDKKMRFGYNGTFTTTDSGLAQEIDKVYGRKGNQQVAVIQSETKEPGHNYRFQGVDTSHFKVWVLKRGKVVRVTKAQAQRQGYKIISGTRKRPEVHNDLR